MSLLPDFCQLPAPAPGRPNLGRAVVLGQRDGDHLLLPPVLYHGPPLKSGWIFGILAGIGDPPAPAGGPDFLKDGACRQVMSFSRLSQDFILTFPCFSSDSCLPFS